MDKYKNVPNHQPRKSLGIIIPFIRFVWLRNSHLYGWDKRCPKSTSEGIHQRYDRCVSFSEKLAKKTVSCSNSHACIWVNYNISLTGIKAIWGWFPLFAMIPVRSQWGHYNLPRCNVLYTNTSLFFVNYDNDRLNIHLWCLTQHISWSLWSLCQVVVGLGGTPGDTLKPTKQL